LIHNIIAAAGDTTLSLDLDVVGRLLGAMVLGGLVGLEREASDQPAGLRTHIAVAVGASLFGIISTLGFLEFDRPRAESTIQADVTRVASNVVVGIGFLGAGVIFRQGSTIRNLTTAASLWTVAAIGLACGVGDITSAGLATAVLLVSLVLLRPLRTFVRRHWATRSTTVRLRLRRGTDPATVIGALDETSGVETDKFSVRSEDGQLILSTDVSGPPTALHRWLARLAESPDVESVDER
jgi:putative Mg2+ transporter-C (MgtC) family protein